MKFSEQHIDNSLNYIKSYSPKSVTVKNKVYKNNIIIPSKKAIIELNIKFNDFKIDNFPLEVLDEVNLVIIGYNTFSNNKTPLLFQLNEKSIGSEIMNLESTYRTHNILLSEERNFCSIIFYD
ncbi:MAG: MTH938/NDUFAF3 family protein [Pseudomonadota bacterium]|nr:MTH938/NDUFAF3 family protein [Pseudomonadota bacterium]|tara:strand:+ start:819 stop:1187 length:369 start_codon:yes stop_codon:yes gene_type:complete